MGKAEAYVVVAVVRIVPVTVGNRAVLCVVVPAAAADHPVRSRDHAPVFLIACCFSPLDRACSVNASKGVICSWYSYSDHISVRRK